MKRIFLPAILILVSCSSAIFSDGLNFGPIQAINKKVDEYNVAAARKSRTNISGANQILASSLSGNYYGLNNGGYVFAAANSPYQITGDVYVGANTIIEAGVVIKFMPNYSMSLNGDVTINGTAQHPVIFTSGKQTPKLGDYGTVSLGSYANHLNVNYVTFQYGNGQFISGDAASKILNSSFTSYNYNNSYINTNGAVKYCNFMNVTISGSPVISYCNISGSVSTLNGDGQYSINYSNLGDGFQTITNNGNWTIDVTNNWWGVAYSTMVPNFIYSPEGTVTYIPIQTSTVTAAGVQ